MPKNSLKSSISKLFIGLTSILFFTEVSMAQSQAVINKSTTQISKKTSLKEASKTDLEFNLTSVNYAEASEVDSSALVQAEARLKMKNEGSTFSGLDCIIFCLKRI
jgi:hypothetical protein